MNVTIVSPFRDSVTKIPAYLQRLESLDYPIAQLEYVFVEGDSTDHTEALLNQWAEWAGNVQLVTCNTGKPHYGSVVDAERFRVLATVFNAGLDAVDLDWSDYVLFLPSDIQYEPDLLTRLLAHGKDIIAPFPYLDGRFYDIWGFSRNGQNFWPHTREQAPEMFGDQPIKMDTVGCVMLMRYEILFQGVRYADEDVDRGLCNDARALGFTVWADPTTEVYHP
jgi:glycosyltransferase involved in cell wall biosynthesis